MNSIINSIGEELEVEGPRFKGYDETREGKEFIESYAAPPGYAILTAKIHEHAAHGNYTYGLTITGKNSSLVQQVDIKNGLKKLFDASGKLNFETTGKGHKQDISAKLFNEYQARLYRELEQLSNVYSKTDSTHNVVILKGHISAKFKFLGDTEERGHVNLTTTVRIIRLITSNELDQIVESYQKELQEFESKLMEFGK